MIKAIIFDCFGVLTSDNWREFTVTLPDDQRSAASQLTYDYCSGSLTGREFLKAVSKLTGAPEDQIKGIINHQDVGAGKNTQLLAFIAVLKQSYKIGLLSNVGNSWIKDDFLTDEEQKLFDNYIFSYEIGFAKPDPRMFELAAERLGVPLSACVLVDDVERYCTVAQQLGMQTVVYQNFPQTKADLQKLLS